MQHQLTSILSSLLCMYLPIPEVGTRIACGMALAQVIVTVLTTIYNKATLFTNIINYFWSENYVIINVDNPSYDKIIDYLYVKYINNISGCKLEADFGKNKMIINKLTREEVIDIFIDTEDNSNHTIKIRLQESTSGSNNNSRNNNNNNHSRDDKIIYITSQSSTMILEKYINSLIRKSNEKVSNDIVMFKLTVVKFKDSRTVQWKSYKTKTSKNKTNTIVSETVKKNFYDDLDTFINGEAHYSKRGLPYKRGYIFHGEPGCGKTSMIKAVANDYQLPIFVLDLSILESNDELTKAASEINNHVSINQRHLFIMEDVDRSKMFKRSRNHYYGDDNNSKKITEDCLLNVIDGVDENYGRITVMTANDCEVLTKIEAMMRPGRIDMVVHVSLCTVLQIKQIISFHFDMDIDQIIIEGDIKISPAKLIHLIMSVGQYIEVIKILTANNDFTELSIEDMMKLNDEPNYKLKDTTSKKINKKDNIIEDDRNKDDDIIMTNMECNIRRRLAAIDKLKLELQKLDKSLDNNNEHDKLILQKKKINLRIDELAVEKLRLEHNYRYASANIKIPVESIQTEHVMKQLKNNNNKKSTSDIDKDIDIDKELDRELAKLDENTDKDTTIKPVGEGVPVDTTIPVIPVGEDVSVDSNSIEVGYHQVDDALDAS